MTDLTIPEDWDQVTPEWMTAALASTFPGLDVTDVQLLLRDDGTNRRARFGLTVAGADGPATVFLKAADPDHAALNAATGGLFNEPRLFSSNVELPVDHPKVYASRYDEDSLDFLLVMEDVTGRGGEPRHSTTPLTVEQALDGVRGLARLHAAFWAHRLNDHAELRWVDPYIGWQGMGGGIEIGLGRVADVPEAVRALGGDRIEEIWLGYIETVMDGPLTLLHGDPHIGNTYVLPGDKVGFLDWQVLRRGHQSIDLGYFLQSALTIDDRRSSEEQLVAGYNDSLDLPDEERPTFDETWTRYRASAAHGLALWMATASSDTWQRPEVSIPLAERYAAAFVDLGSGAAIASLSHS